ncbi:hypothetical protein BRD56_08780 [Thermoplasmatales archaeon SW_10_69_26]|nr:MAG: hypothetical protein BRD56_08780 [Thermoplasmatales archaeon SW_10_69_26]
MPEIARTGEISGGDNEIARLRPAHQNISGPTVSDIEVASGYSFVSAPRFHRLRPSESLTQAQPAV